MATKQNWNTKKTSKRLMKAKKLVEVKPLLSFSFGASNPVDH